MKLLHKSALRAPIDYTGFDSGWTGLGQSRAGLGQSRAGLGQSRTGLGQSRAGVVPLAICVMWMLISANGCGRGSQESPSQSEPNGAPATENRASENRVADDAVAANANEQAKLDGSASRAGGEISGVALETRYGGTQSCAQCHAEQFDSYSQTTHSRSLRLADPDASLTETTMFHATSKRSYEIVSDRGKLRHREWEHFVSRGSALKTADAKLPLADLPVQYVMGSGKFAEAYLLRDGDYLLQSPVTWYISDHEYAMAPGYDEPVHHGCNRVIEARCLFCHAGMISRSTPQQPTVTELAIGCERCHGASASHVAFHQSVTAEVTGGDSDAVDLPLQAQSIDPASLDRTELESICAQCHLGADVVVDAPGKSVWDFVPGEDFALTRLVYLAEDGIKDDPFSMHFDDLWQSACYKQSETLTCVTCHDPHHDPPTGNVDAVYRDACIECHTNDQCGVPLQQRHAEQQNRCVVCHMPARPSAAVHASTTNHRIGIHKPSETDVPSKPVKRVVLRRLQPRPAGMSAEEIQLADKLAEAYWLVEQEGDPVKTRGLDAAELEQSLLNLEPSPPTRVLAVLARLAGFQAERSADDRTSEKHFARSAEYARRALAEPGIELDARIGALEMLANQQYYAGDYSGAVESYQQLVGLRRAAIDHYNLGISLGKTGQFNAAEQAFREAIRINPSYPLPYRSLSKLYRSLNIQMAKQMENIANALIINEQR